MTEQDKQTIRAHAAVVAKALDCAGWPLDPPHNIQAYAAWAYVEGFANGRDMTGRELLASLAQPDADALFVEREATVFTACSCHGCAGLGEQRRAA